VRRLLFHSPHLFGVPGLKKYAGCMAIAPHRVTLLLLLETLCKNT
jgi:hypothetical protein